MRAIAFGALVVAGVSGSALGAGEPIQLEPSRGEVRHAGHIYFNVATGEKITTLIGAGDTQGAAVGDPGTEIWISNTGAQCADFGYDSTFYFGLDDPTGTSLLSHNAIFFDWSEIAHNTVVDCVQVHWVTGHMDTDSDSDGVADGVEGFGANWIYWDAINASPVSLVECVCAPIIGFDFFSLPGIFPPEPGEMAKWTADIDLGTELEFSMVFEIGDNDGDRNGADVHNYRMDLRDGDSDGNADNDFNGNGLADWGWSIQFAQPGSADLDNADGDDDWSTGIDGSLDDQAIAGVSFGSPTPGHPSYDADLDRWVWVSDGPTAGLTHDRFILGYDSAWGGYGPYRSNGLYGHFWFGGLDCSAGQTTGYTPAAHFQMVLYGPGGVCQADLAGNPDGSPDGTLNFLDISAFLALFAEGDPWIDLAGNPDGSPDGVLNFFDVSAYLALFAAGCP